MRNLTKKILILLIPLCLFSANILQADEDTPAWILFQKGMSYYSQKNYGEAFKAFREATNKNEYPEAEYWIGKIFENEGDDTLALRQYERALNISYKAESSEFYIAILLSIANIYEKQKKYNLYEETLTKIINDVKRAAKSDMEYEKVLGDRLIVSGLDKAIFYFRYDLDPLITPYGELGIYLLKIAKDRNGVRNAIRYLTSSVIIIFTRLIEVNREYDPHYDYTDSRDLLLNSEKDNRTAEYMIESGLYKYLFFLALALDNMEEFQQSKYIFSFLAESSVKNNYTDISLRIKNNNYFSSYKDGVKKALLFIQED
ncbi:MAG: tetratricopeptide repeat protein [Spirochaetaceae bacterium]|nr:tetratricopeptide repeat protein [Spirochaetaceae bacterium]